MEKLKRYIVFLIGLFINSLGVSLITKADLGTSPISSIPYVLNLNFPFTLGQFTIAFSLLLILIQLVILRRNFKAEHLLQIPISVLFGYFIDLTMEMLFFVHPQTYLSSELYLPHGRQNSDLPRLPLTCRWPLSRQSFLSSSPIAWTVSEKEQSLPLCLSVSSPGCSDADSPFSRLHFFEPEITVNNNRR